MPCFFVFCCHVSFNQQAVLDCRMIRNHYIKTWFIPDLLAVAPVDYCLLILSVCIVIFAVGCKFQDAQSMFTCCTCCCFGDRFLILQMYSLLISALGVRCVWTRPVWECLKDQKGIQPPAAPEGLQAGALCKWLHGGKWTYGVIGVILGYISVCC